MHRAFHVLAALAVPLVAAFPLAAAPDNRSVDIKEWPVPWAGSHPGSPVPSGADLVWFVGETGNYIASLNPRTGVFKRIDLIDEPAPHSLVVASSGMAWFSSPLLGYIGRFDPQTRTISRTPMPYAAAADPYTLVVEPGERNIWFSLQSSNMIGRLRIENGIVDLIGVPTPKANPDGVTPAPNGSPWIALAGTNKVATVDPRTFVIKEYTLPRAAARPRRLGFTTDGRVWYADFAEGYLGALTPAISTTANPNPGGGAPLASKAGGGSTPSAPAAAPTAALVADAVKEWRLPDGQGSHPFALAVDAKDRIWMVETGTKPSKLVGFDPKTGRFFSSTPITSGGGAVRDLRYDRASGGLWFSTETNTIGFAKIEAATTR